MKHGRCTGELQTTYEVLAYLADHPDAQDTLEGIMEWWLLEQQVKRETAKAKEALDELVAEGLVLEHKGRDSRSFYKINRRRLREIQALLKERSK